MDQVILVDTHPAVKKIIHINKIITFWGLLYHMLKGCLNSLEVSKRTLTDMYILSIKSSLKTYDAYQMENLHILGPLHKLDAMTKPYSSFYQARF